MAFGSAIFLCAFLPLTAALYALLPGLRARNVLLAAAGLIFYAFGRLADLPVLLASVVVHYAAGRLLLRLRRGRRAVTAAAVVLDAGLLVFYKYLDFFLGALLPRWTGQGLALPLGISFFTFQGISYVVDAYRDPAKASRRFFPVLLYMTFFPNLVSGPLQRFSDFRPALTARTATAEDAAAGLRRFSAGLAKKLLLAGTLAAAADAVYALPAEALDIRAAWLGALCYALQIFFDFSGYSDMAVGLARLFGFRLPENFRDPYCASSVTDFWRRWHISLSLWFRDYLYIPLGGNRRGRARTAVNKGIVFLCTGLWHGASWTFVLWGLWHGLFSVLESVTPLRRRVEGRWYGHVYALLVAVLGFALFRAESLAQGGRMLAALFAGFPLTQSAAWLLEDAVSRRLLLTLAVSIPLAAGIGPRLRQRLAGRRCLPLLQAAGALALLALSLMALAAGSFQPFIYQQF